MFHSSFLLSKLFVHFFSPLIYYPCSKLVLVLFILSLLYFLFEGCLFSFSPEDHLKTFSLHLHFYILDWSTSRWWCIFWSLPFLCNNNSIHKIIHAGSWLFSVLFCWRSSQGKRWSCQHDLALVRERKN